MNKRSLESILDSRFTSISNLEETNVGGLTFKFTAAATQLNGKPDSSPDTGIDG
jgi:hypothetical protein